MKKILFLLAVTACVFVGCFETNEVIEINENGSGVYKSSMDMSAMFDFIDKMKEDFKSDSNDDSKSKKEKDIDTFMMMKDIVDTATGITEEQRRLMRPMKMRLQMNEKERKFLIEVTYPYTSLSDLEKIMDLEKEGKGMSMLGKNAPLPGMDEDASEENPESPFGKLGTIFKYNFKNGSLGRTVIKDSVDAMLQSPQMAQMGQMQEILSGVKFNLSFQLPRPAKNVSGSRVVLSSDKMRVTVNTSMKDLFEDPTAFNYHIEY